jgi:hypothetical protein
VYCISCNFTIRRKNLRINLVIALSLGTVIQTIGFGVATATATATANDFYKSCKNIKEKIFFLQVATTKLILMGRQAISHLKFIAICLVMLA